MMILIATVTILLTMVLITVVYYDLFRRQVLEDLKHQIPDYDKGRDCYRKLKDHTQQAIERCKTKEKQYKAFNWPSGDCNPRTDVAELVELLVK